MDSAPASVARLRADNAQAHGRRHTRECYYVLEGEGAILIDGEEAPARAGDCVWIRPGHMRCATGNLETLIIGTPPFDYDDVLMDRPMPEK